MHIHRYSDRYIRFSDASMAKSLPVCIVEVPLLIHMLAFALNRTRKSEVPGRELHETVPVVCAGSLLDAGVIQIGHFELSVHNHKLTRPEIQQCHRAKGRVG